MNDLKGPIAVLLPSGPVSVYVDGPDVYPSRILAPDEFQTVRERVREHIFTSPPEPGSAPVVVVGAARDSGPA
jgi:phage gp45-like